ncbi:MAG: hypothetical protein ACI3V0_10730, partial [Faecousia sp.]
NRLDDSGLNAQELIRENERNLALCKQYGWEYILIDDEYQLAVRSIADIDEELLGWIQEAAEFSSSKR